MGQDRIDKLLEWLAKFFGHIPTHGVEALLFKGIQALLVLFVVYLGIHIVLKGIELRFRKADQSSDEAVRVYKKLTRYALWTLGVLLALHVAGFNLSTLFTTSGLFALAIGFALKDIAGNYVSGIILKANDTIKRGDVLDVDGQMVKVKSIGFRDTIVRTKDEGDILIPNALLVQGKIGNYTLRDSLSRVWTAVGVSYSSDLNKVRDVLEEVCRNFGGQSSKHPPVVLLTDFGSSSVNYQVFVWTENPWNRRVIKSQLNEAVWWGLKNAGIEIAFPQLDVHLNKPLD
jgi:small-conductance mechanosensitive channel